MALQWSRPMTEEGEGSLLRQRVKGMVWTLVSWGTSGREIGVTARKEMLLKTQLVIILFPSLSVSRDAFVFYVCKRIIHTCCVED